MNLKKLVAELQSDGVQPNEADIKTIVEHMAQRISMRDQVRARAIATVCFYLGITKVVKMWDMNVACRHHEWSKAAKLIEASELAGLVPQAARRVGTMLRTGRDP